MIGFVKKNQRGDVIAKTQKYEIGDDERERTIFGKSGDLTLIICDKDLVKSSRILNKISSLAYDIFDSVYDYFQQVYVAQSHTLKKIQGQLNQKIESLIQISGYEEADTFEGKKQVLMNSIIGSPEDTAESIIYLQKRIFELEAHMASFELLYLGEMVHVDMKRHNIRRLILNVWHGFDAQFRVKDVRYRFNFEDSVAEENKCLLDYKTINAALYNIFDNAVKYSMPDSDVHFSYNVDKSSNSFELVISTLSRRIDEDEVVKLCTFGYRSNWCSGIEGSGVGLFIVKRALDLNGLILKIVPNHATERIIDGVHYFVNGFVITGLLNK